MLARAAARGSALVSSRAVGCVDQPAPHPSPLPEEEGAAYLPMRQLRGLAGICWNVRWPHDSIDTPHPSPLTEGEELVFAGTAALGRRGSRHVGRIDVHWPTWSRSLLRRPFAGCVAYGWLRASRPSSACRHDRHRACALRFETGAEQTLGFVKLGPENGAREARLRAVLDVSGMLGPHDPPLAVEAVAKSARPHQAIQTSSGRPGFRSRSTCTGCSGP